MFLRRSFSPIENAGGGESSLENVVADAASEDEEDVFGAEFDESSVGDREGREARVFVLRQKMMELFPGDDVDSVELRSEIERSFSVPQVGAFHKEGLMMDSHLDRMYSVIDDVKNGEFAEGISEYAREVLERAIVVDEGACERYVLEHDIAKAYCMTMEIGGEKRSVTWDEWQDMLGDTDDGLLARDGDEEALGRFVDDAQITQISYWQKSEKGSLQHGDVGARMILEGGVEEDMRLVTAIKTHEVAYQFTRVNMPIYDKYFGGLDEATRDFCMLGSYVDTMATVREDGLPDLSNFELYVASREKSDAFVELFSIMGDEDVWDVLLAISRGEKDSQSRMREVVDRIAGSSYKSGVMMRELMSLRKNDEVLTFENLGDVAKRIFKASEVPRYDLDVLRNGALDLVAEGKISRDDVELLIDTARDNPEGIGRVFGRKMGGLRSILKKSRS